MTNNRRSIRHQLLIWLLVPLCSLSLVGSVIAYLLAELVTNEAYDEIILNSADSVAARVSIQGNKILVDMPPAAKDILEHNDKDRFFYQVLTSDGRQISGDAPLPFPEEARSLQPWKAYYCTAMVQDNVVRQCVLRIPVPAPNRSQESLWIIVAETLRSRQEFANKIVISIVLPQMFLIVLGWAAVSVGVSRGLYPLQTLQHDLAKRSQFDMSPIPDETMPAEVRPMLHALNELLHRLQADIEAQRRFVANAAHQLRTPISGLKTYLDLLKRFKHKSDVQEIVVQLDVGFERLGRLVNNLLLLARAEASNAFDHREQCDLNTAASDVLRISAVQAAQKPVEIIFEPSTEPATVQGNVGSLQEMISNLVENAIIYTQAGGEVRVSVQRKSNYFLLSVEDNGPGIPPEERERVFERFYRILGSGIPGNGLGLAIVKEIATMHGASVKIESGQQSIGTRVLVEFPYRKN